MHIKNRLVNAWRSSGWDARGLKQGFAACFHSESIPPETHMTRHARPQSRGPNRVWVICHRPANNTNRSSCPESAAANRATPDCLGDMCLAERHGSAGSVHQAPHRPHCVRASCARQCGARAAGGVSWAGISAGQIEIPASSVHTTRHSPSCFNQGTHQRRRSPGVTTQHHAAIRRVPIHCIPLACVTCPLGACTAPGTGSFSASNAERVSNR